MARMSDFVPTIHATVDELNTELFWATYIDPVARQHGMEMPTEMHIDPGDHNRHVLKGPDGRVLLVVRTDREPA